MRRSTPSGRSRLTLHRALVLTAVALAAVALAGSAAASPAAATADVTSLEHDEPDDVDRTLSFEELEGQTFWRGERIAVEGLHSGETVEFHGGDSSERETATGTSVQFDVGRLEAGEWTAVRADAGENASFFVREQRLNQFTVRRTPLGDVRDLRFQSNRETYEVALRASDVDAERLASAVDGGTVHGDALVLQADGAVERRLDTATLGAGAYELTASVTDANASATTRFVVADENRSGQVYYDGQPLDGDVVWQGQQLRIHGFEAGETVELVEISGDGFHRSTANSNGTLELDTSSLRFADWHVSGASSGVTRTFSLQTQRFLALQLRPSPASDLAALTVDTNREEYDLALRSESIAAEEFDAAFDDPAGSVRDGDFVLTGGDGSYDLNVTELPVGEHEVAANVPDSTASGTATLAVDRRGPVHVDDLDGQSVWQGERVTVTGFEDGESVSVVRDDDQIRSFRATNGSVTVDTASLEAGDWAIGGNETVGSSYVTVRKQEIDEFAVEPASHGFSATLTIDSNRAQYAIALDVAGVDAATLDAAVEGGFVQDGRLVLFVSGGLDRDVDTSALPTGTHAIEASVIDSTATASTEFRVNDSESTDGESDRGDDAVAVGDLNGQPYWQGGELAIDGFEPGETVEFEQSDGDGFIRTVASDAGLVAVDTAAFSVGEWTVTGVDSGSSGTFTLPEHAIQTFEPVPSVADDSTTLTVDSNRADYDLRLTAGSVSAAEFDAAFDAGTVRDGAYVLPGDGEYAMNVTGLPEGEYEIVAEAPDTTASASTTLTVSNQTPVVADFASDSRTEHVGDVVTIPVETRGAAGDVWLSIQEDSENFEATVRATVENGSEPLRIQWNTHHGLDPDRNHGFSAENGEIRSVDASGPAVAAAEHWPNEEWTFNLESYTSASDAENADFDDVAIVFLEERSTDELTTWTAPGVQGHSPDDDVEEILEDATQRTTVANRDLLIAEVEASGVYGYLNESPDGFQTEGLEFTVEGNPRFGTAPGASVAELGDDASITARPDEDVFYVVVDSSDVPEIQDGDTWDAEFSIEGADNPYVTNPNDDETEPDEAVSDAFTFETREIEITGNYDEDDQLQLPAEPDATVTAVTNVAPGTPVHLRLNLPQDFRTASGEVAEDGTFSAAVDLSGLEEATRLSRVRVRAPNSNTQHEVEGVIDEDDVVRASFAVRADAPSTANVSEDATVDVRIQNEGDVADTVALTVEMDGEAVTDDAFVLRGGEAATASYYVPTDEPGAVNWSVATQHDAASGVVEVGETVRIDGYEPQPYEGSELYYDVTGDGSVGQTDVVEFFRHQHRESWKRPDLFDFTGDGTVGHGDVVELFEVVATGALDEPSVDGRPDEDDGGGSGFGASAT